jgi:hypothetical protein
MNPIFKIPCNMSSSSTTNVANTMENERFELQNGANNKENGQN